MERNNKTSGIYQIKSTQTNKIYIGKSAHLESRKSQHFRRLLNNSHQNTNLQKHFNIYGINDFVFSTMEICIPSKLLSREQYYIDILKPEFNISQISYGGGMTERKHSKESKEKVRNSMLRYYKGSEGKERTSEAMKLCRSLSNKKLYKSAKERHDAYRIRQKLERIKKYLNILSEKGIVKASETNNENSYVIPKKLLSNQNHL